MGRETCQEGKNARRYVLIGTLPEVYIYNAFSAIFKYQKEGRG
jgi:hypothetical protein